MNNEQPRKPMQDILIPHQELARRTPSSVPPIQSSSASMPPLVPPTLRTPPAETAGGNRIDSNPFFEKAATSGSVNNKKNKTRYVIWSLVVFAVCGLALAIAQYFSSAIVVVTPVKKAVHLDHELSVPATASSTELTFQFMSFKEEQTKEVPATVEKEIQKKASGTVLIYNAYSAAPQRLIINTRLESPDHKIFKIDSSIEVPGATMSKAGTVVTPGVAEVVAYADVPGKEYNIGLSDFTIPGLKGSPRYAKFTARSKPNSPMAGGFAGVVKVSEESAIIAAQNEMKEELKKVAAAKVQAQLPPGSTFFPGSIIVRFEEIPYEFSKENTTKISMRAIASVFFFDEKLLAERITRTVSPEGSQAVLSLGDISGITFSFLDPVENVVFSDLKRIRFKLVGDLALLGQVDIEKLRSLLVGATKKSFDGIVKSQPSIEKANLTFRPVWNTKFPADGKKINIKLDDK